MSVHLVANAPDKDSYDASLQPTFGRHRETNGNEQIGEWGVGMEWGERGRGVGMEWGEGGRGGVPSTPTTTITETERW